MPQVERIGDIAKPAGKLGGHKPRDAAAGAAADDDKYRATERQKRQWTWIRSGISNKSAGEKQGNKTNDGHDSAEEFRDLDLGAVNSQDRAQGQFPCT